jgi:hypothetical protein
MQPQARRVQPKRLGLRVQLVPLLELGLEQ